MPHGAVHVASHPSGRYVYVSGGRVSEVEVATGAVVRQLGTATSTQDIVVSGDGSTLYLVSEFDQRFQAVELATGRVTLSLALPCPPYGLAVSPDGARAYAACGTQLMTVDLEHQQLLPSVPLSGGVGIRRMAMSPDGRVLVLAGEGTVAYIVR